MFSLRFLAVISILVFCLSSCRTPSVRQQAVPERIVSLAPGITETLFALGLGDRIVGVTAYCVYPPQAQAKEKIGGYTDANLEKIIMMHPDLVVLSLEHEKQRQYLERFNIPVLAVGSANCTEVCSTFAVIGRRCAVVKAADSLIMLFSDRLAVQNRDTALGVRPSVLFCVGRENPAAGKIAGAFFAGKGTFYDDLISAAGGHNALERQGQQYCRLSVEGILSENPDIIIDIASAMENFPCSLLVRDWQPMGRLAAVVNRQVYCLAQSYSTIPGPRLLLLLEDIRNIVDAYKNSRKS